MVKNSIKNLVLEKKIAFLATVFVMVTILFIGSIMFSMSAKAKEISTGYKYYTSIIVEKGDTLWDIANMYMSPEYTDIKKYIYEVKTLNHLKGDEIHAGEYLTIPYYSSDRL